MGNVVYVTPALTIGEADLRKLLEILRESVECVVSKNRKNGKMGSAGSKTGRHS